MGLARIVAIAGPEEPAVRLAAAALRAGEIVALPTETVYGLAARADAAERLAGIKGRDPAKPFQRLLAGIEEVEKYALPLEGAALRLARRFWPGPLTLVAPDKAGGMVGLRVPDNAVTRAIIAATDGPVIATSANLAGTEPCLSAAEVRAEFGDVIALIVEAPPLPRGIASTVVEAREGRWRILRTGALSAEEIEKAAGEETKERI